MNKETKNFTSYTEVQEYQEDNAYTIDELKTQIKEDIINVESIDFNCYCELFEFSEEENLSFADICEEVPSDDFTVENYRFISHNEIDDIMLEELSGDAYILGCFNASFIADNTNLSIEIVEALQESDKCEVLGQHIIDNDLVADIQEEYVNSDGYGHHFGHYDGNYEEVTDYYIFRIN